MKILIPTYNRIDNQITYNGLDKSISKYVRLVVHPNEAAEHRKRGRLVLECPVQGKGMAAVRSWIFDWCVNEDVEKVFLLDDDLMLQKRSPDLRVVGKSSKEEQQEMIDWVRNTLDTYDHCAFTERNAAWADANETAEATKGIQAVGYNIRRIAETDCRFNKGVPDWFFIEDYHMTLQLFRAGRPNLVSRLYRVSFGPSNAAGGCSLQRTPEKLEKAAKLLESLHPEFVKAVEKETKTSYGGGKRWNVKVMWKKAFESSQKKSPRDKRGDTSKRVSLFD